MKRKLSRQLLLFLVPALVIYLIFNLYPVFQSIRLSFFEWDGFKGTEAFVGLGNYRDLVKDEYFGIALKNSFILVGYGLFIKLPFAMLLALGVNYRGVRLQKFFRFTSFMPCIISTAAVALMWQIMYNPDFGLINSLLRAINLDHLARPWLADAKYAIYFGLVPSIWSSVGFNFVLYSSGLASIPNQIIEAARIDGATYPKMIKSFYLPLLRDIIVISLVLDLIGALKSFDMIWILTSGGPVESTHLLATYMYKQAFTLRNFGYGSAIATVILVLAMIYTLGLNIATRREIKE